MKYIDFFFNSLMDLFIHIAKVLLVAMTVLVCVGVFYRYVLNQGIKWSDEVASLMMVYFGFISIAYGVKKELHLSVEMFFKMFPEKMQFILYRITSAITSVLGCVMAVYGVLLMKSTTGNVMTATRWPYGTVYAIVPVAGVFIAYFAFAEAIGYKSTFKSYEKESEQ